MRMTSLVLAALSAGAPCLDAQSIVQVLDASGDGVHPLVRPEALAVDATGNLFVVGNDSDNVFRVTPAGTVTQIIDATGDGQGHALLDPSDVAVDHLGNVFVVGRQSSNLFRIEPDGTITQLLDVTGDGLGKAYEFPFGVAVGGSGAVYSVGMTDDTVFRVAPDGSISTLVAEAAWTLRLAADADDDVYVTGFLTSNGNRIAPDGTVTPLIAFSGDGMGNAFDVGYGVAVAGTGDVYMAGTLSQNLFRIAPDGAITEILDDTGDGTHPFASWFGLYSPFDVAVDGAGRVYANGFVSHNVFRVDPDGTIAQVLDAAGDGTHALQSPAGVAVDATGTLWVSGAGSHNVFRIAPDPALQVTQLVAAVQALQADGGLAPGQAQALLVKLRRVNAALGGTPSQACGPLGAFVDQVTAFAFVGILSAAQAQPLLDGASALQATLGCAPGLR